MAYKSTKHLGGLVPGQSNVALLVDELVFGGEALESVVGHPALVAEVGHAGLTWEGGMNVINDVSTACLLTPGTVLLGGLECGARPPGEGVGEDGLPVVS